MSSLCLRMSSQGINAAQNDPNAILVETAEPFCFIVFRETKDEATRRWVMKGAGQQRRKSANYLNRQITDHILAFEWNGEGEKWIWKLSNESIAFMGILRVPMNDPMRVPPPKVLLCLDEAID